MPTAVDLKRAIERDLQSYRATSSKEAARKLLETLGYESNKTISIEPNTPRGFKEFLTKNGVTGFNDLKAHLGEWQSVDFLFQLTDDEISRALTLFKSELEAVDVTNKRIESYLFFAIELKAFDYSRTKLAEITREINRVFPMPVMIIFRHGDLVTFSIIDRRIHKREASKDVLGKVTLIKDIRVEDPHRAHIEILANLALENLKGPRDWIELHEEWRRVLDLELVTDSFFRDYKKVFQSVGVEVAKSIPDLDTARLFTQRLLNRLLFIYFIQKKGLMKFQGSEDYLRTIYDTAVEKDENFYRERLWWVFFYGLSNLNESVEVHSNEKLIERRGEVPYLNGGLFELEKDGFDARDKVSIPNSSFELILGLFEKYQFTVEESTPLEVQVAIDPEILGRVFEELVTGRHESGSYYTPRQIVSFMCRESLKYYLAAYEKKETIDQFVDEGNGENLSNPEEILEAIKKIRVCDPACGSGAYLLGMMQELLHLREALFASKHLGEASLYNRKREIIENNIYGVDKDRFAVQIASLRLWLSLAIESNNPRPLPNLKYKIGCGDSLLSPFEDEVQPDLHRRALIEQFRARKADYAKAFDYSEKREIDAEIKRLRVDIAQSLKHLPEPPKPYQIALAENEVGPLQEKIQRRIKAGDRLKAEHFQKDLNKLIEQIDNWKSQLRVEEYETGEIFDWTVEFAEVFADGGFDVVLANPPYVRMELFKPLKPQLRQNFPKAHSDRADLYVYFFARVMQLLKDGGIGTFISSFFAVKLKVVRIGDSPFAPVFEILERPNNWERHLHAAVPSSGEMSALGLQRLAFWTEFVNRIPSEVDHGGPGATSNRWHELPDIGMTLSMLTSTTGVGIFIRALRGGSPEALRERLITKAGEISEALGVEIGTDTRYFFVDEIKGDYSDASQRNELIDWLGEKVSLYESTLLRAFSVE